MVVLSALRIKVEIVDVCMWSVTKMWNNFVGIKFHFYQGTHMVQEVILLRSLKWNVTLPYSTCLILKYKIMSPIAKLDLWHQGVMVCFLVVNESLVDH
jgi:hypothetical protein